MGGRKTGLAYTQGTEEHKMFGEWSLTENKIAGPALKSRVRFQTPEDAAEITGKISYTLSLKGIRKIFMQGLDIDTKAVLHFSEMKKDSR
jgi:hypothetical protein